MAGVLVHDAQRTADLSLSRPRDLCRVAHARAERASALCPRRVFMEHIAVSLQVGAASRRVRDHRQVAAGERVNVQPSKLPRTLAVAGVRVQRTAAHLLDRCSDAVPVALEDTHRGSLGLSERLAHHAAREETHIGVFALRERERCTFGSGSEATQPRESARSEAPRHRRESAAHDDIGELRCEGKSPLARDRVETDPPHSARDRTRGAPLGDDLSSALHDPAEGNARWTRGLARAAHEARIEVPRERRGGCHRRRHELSDELDAPAWRVRLLAEDAVGRTIVEAQPARDARGEILGADVRGERSDRP